MAFLTGPAGAARATARPSLSNFAVDARRAPKWGLDAHPPDQRAQFRLDLRPSYVNNNESRRDANAQAFQAG
jgi:hypothetical protein